MEIIDLTKPDLNEIAQERFEISTGEVIQNIAEFTSKLVRETTNCVFSGVREGKTLKFIKNIPAEAKDLIAFTNRGKDISNPKK